jgi:sugar lactone lactonase YvrE
VGERGTGLGQFQKPRSVAVDREDNLYVVDMTGRVQKFSPAGEFLLFWQMPETELGRPKGMCRDSDGNVVVLEPHYARVNHYSTTGELVSSWGVQGTEPGQLSFPRAVVATPDGRIYVSEYMQREWVQLFGRDRAVQRVIGAGGREAGQFNRAEGLALDQAGRLYVADSCNHRVQVFDAEGRHLRSYGTAGSGLGEMSYPYDVAVDDQGRQYICEFGNSRIQIFDSTGRPLEIVGGPGAAPGEFSNPWSIALDSHGNLYVADSMNHRVQKLIRRNPTG